MIAVGKVFFPNTTSALGAMSESPAVGSTLSHMNRLTGGEASSGSTLDQVTGAAAAITLNQP